MVWKKGDFRKDKKVPLTQLHSGKIKTVENSHSCFPLVQLGEGYVSILSIERVKNESFFDIFQFVSQYVCSKFLVHS
ncbi:hypothetical protein SCIP_0383 [Scardovia inopinata JCM 12537]|nr:hypothetical protein SCIP_0383 [Scardovia inopinata JCM 12537]